MARSVERMRSSSRERERELVLAFQAGDAAAYESIDRSCRPAAERICRRLLINPADVEEAVQETMVRAYQGLPRFNGSYALKAWVARIATNVCLDTLRARSRRPVNGGTLEPNMDAPNGHDGNGHRDDPEELLEQAADAEEVRRVLSALPERHRTALVLREFEGYSHRKIAEMLDTSPARVKALIHRAKAGFRRAWKDDNGGRLAAFAPLLTPINWWRRLFGRAPEFDHSSVASAAGAAGSPAAHSLVTIASERVPVLAAVMLAGAVGFAANNAQKPSGAEEPPAVVEIVRAPSPAEDAKLAGDTETRREKDKGSGEGARKRKDPPVPAVAPAAEQELEEVVGGPTGQGTAEPAPGPSPTPGPSPSPEPPPSPPAAPGPPPPWNLAFISDMSTKATCGCNVDSRLWQSKESGEAGKEISFRQEAVGAVRDAEGDPAWKFWVEYSGWADGGNGSLGARFYLVGGTIGYEASAGLAAVVKNGDGTYTYTYSGTYEQTHRSGDEHAPYDGGFTLTATFWADGHTLYDVKIALQ